MLSIKRHKQFSKDFLHVKMSEKHFAKFVVYVAKLLQSESLPPEALDHCLEGNWSGFREFHVSGDLLVIYFLDEQMLNLIRLGSHSELFE
ncbi:type II toxin-antitoxin system RelE/ParE family toxin [Sulfurospirillum cavolei]|uniref:type II toxin-antitoxin system RelE/ParE family toxin n=1 Tax=Sulfurospirillum cavolei TaxID=366522 RepID=UPI0005A9B4CD|nr:type II toxin-antitoxin system YafQ family toxin [Sulfurospirillum cavolei]